MHFNEIGMRIRGFFVTILLALFASVGFLLDKKLPLSVGFVSIQFATIMPLFGIFISMLFDGPILVSSSTQGDSQSRYRN